MPKHAESAHERRHNKTMRNDIQNPRRDDAKIVGLWADFGQFKLNPLMNILHCTFATLSDYDRSPNDFDRLAEYAWCGVGEWNGSFRRSLESQAVDTALSGGR